MKELIGKKVLELRVSDNQDVLAFVTDDGCVAYRVYGDCCSESWFADITGVPALLGSVVTNAETVSMEGYNFEDGRCRQDWDEAYGTKLTTDKGYVDIVFRNSSNGYYGGEMDIVETKTDASGVHFYVRDFDWKVRESIYESVSDLTAITEDWQA